MTYEASTHLIKTFLNISRAGLELNAELIRSFDIMVSILATSWPYKGCVKNSGNNLIQKLSMQWIMNWCALAVFLSIVNTLQTLTCLYP